MKILDGDVEWETKEWGSEYAVDEAYVDVLGLPIVYQSWSSADSAVVSGPYGPAGMSNFPGRRFRDRRSARVYWSLRATIVEEYRVPGRWIFRIKKKGRA